MAASAMMATAKPINAQLYRQHGELDALEQAERTGKFVEQELCRKGGRKNQRDSAEAERVEGQRERASHGRLGHGRA
jgi:hypothetical protein